MGAYGGNYGANYDLGAVFATINRLADLFIPNRSHDLLLNKKAHDLNV